MKDLMSTSWSVLLISIVVFDALTSPWFYHEKGGNTPDLPVSLLKFCDRIQVHSCCGDVDLFIFPASGIFSPIFECNETFIQIHFDDVPVNTLHSY